MPYDSSYFSYNGNEVTKEEYGTELKKYDTNAYEYVAASYSTAFEFSIENMQKFTQNPLDFINPNEK